MPVKNTFERTLVILLDKLCNSCPRKCGVTRTDREKLCGFCEMPWDFKVARAALHFWEEPCISGKNGSGTVFFSGCNLKCVYCQNYSISHENFGQVVTENQLIDIFEGLISQGANNINLVNPTHYAVQLASLFEKYRPSVPVVYNSSGYENVETLKLLQGKVDVYLPDLKYYREDKSLEYCGVDDYFSVATKAIMEMVRQVGENQFDENGIIQKGMIVRHLILPGNTNSSKEILNWLSKNLPKSSQISLMAQYVPMGEAKSFKDLNRKITRREYEKVANFIQSLGLENGYLQEMESAKNCFVPDFNLEGILQD